MDFKDILVHLDDTPQCAARLSLAVNLALQHGAHLTGLYVITHPHYAPTDPGIGERVAAAEELFRRQVDGSGCDAASIVVDWPVTGVGPSEVVNLYAHSKDLVIVGQGDPGNKDSDLPLDLAERVVMGAGRPVLVVPYAGRFDTIGERVLVAWKDGRASARALADAMPLLYRAKQVHLLTIRSGGEGAHTELPERDIVPHLERHRLNVVLEQMETGEVSVANTLMLYAWENGCDLIVMGVYAMNSRGSLTVGPVAKELFDQMTVPVLMSH